jgi:hypothetical protein
MVLYYNVAQPQNIKEKYVPFDQIDMLVKIPAGREIKQNSFRLSGKLKVLVTPASGQTGAGTERAITPDDQVFLNQYCGAHGLFRSFTESVNDQTIENIAYYPRIVAMKKQAMNAQTELYTNSENLTELTGPYANQILCGQDTNNLIPFSIKPMIAVNKTNQNLPQSKFVQMRIMTQVSSGLEALFSTKLISGSTNSFFSSINFELYDLQLSWYEQNQTSAGDIVLNTTYLNKQTIVSNHTNLNIFAPNVYDAISVSFIKQVDLNTPNTDNNACYQVPGIERIEFTLNGNDSPISYPIETYEDIMVNYKKSLMAGEKHSFSKSLIATGQCFGLGCSFPTSVNDKLGINIDIDNAVFNVSSIKFDAYMYVNGYLTM